MKAVFKRDNKAGNNATQKIQATYKTDSKNENPNHPQNIAIYIEQGENTEAKRANGISIVGIIINGVLAVITLLALWQTMKSNKNSQEFFLAEHKPVLQVTKVTMEPVVVGKAAAFIFDFKCLTSTPIQFIEHRQKASNFELNKNSVDTCNPVFKSDVITDDSNASLKITFGNWDNRDSTYFTNPNYYMYVAMTVKYLNIITKKEGLYYFQVKVRKVYGSSFFADETYYKLINNENEEVNSNDE